ncbi:hypothetical protein NMG60_11026371 [Bertholletia excelsa]
MTMRSSGKQQESNRGGRGRMFTLHQRLYSALNLGLRSSGDKERKWCCLDIEIQRHVIRSIDAFLDCISAEKLQQQPLVKDSVADMVEALEGILQFSNAATLNSASNLAVKMFSIIPSSMLQSYFLDLAHPLTSLLPSCQSQVAISCATVLNVIISNVSSKKEREVWEIFEEGKTVDRIINNIKDFSGENKPIEYVQEMIFLLSKILRQWPPSRFSVWSDAKLMKILEKISLEPNLSVKVAVLQLYAALALCGNGAKKLLERGETNLHVMEQCMSRSDSISAQMEGFKLAQCLVINEEECSKVMKMCCEPIVEAIVNVLSSWSCHSGKIPKDQMSLLIEACRLALITRWPGEHHNHFWKLGVHKVLLNLILNDFHKTHESEHPLSLEEQLPIVQQGLSANFLLVLRPFIWDILGELAAHCPEDLNPKVHGDEHCIDVLIVCACVAFVDSIRNAHQLCDLDISDIVRKEAASRSVLMMIHSPCKYIASKSRYLLSEILRNRGQEYLSYLLDKLSKSQSKIEMKGDVQTIINLMSLACYSSLPQYRRHVIKGEGVRILVSIIRWCLSNNVHVKRSSFALHLQNTFSERTCCWVNTGEWDGEDCLLLFSLWGLAELMHYSGCMEIHPEIFAGEMDNNEVQLVNELKGIFYNTSTSGPRWYAAYILSYFGIYGIPNKLGRRIGKALNLKEFSDFELILTNNATLNVHGVILMVRCPSLLPPEELFPNKRSSNSSFVRKDAEKNERSRKDVRLSAHVDYHALLKLLNYVYFGYLQVGEDLLKQLKIFARHCNLQSLVQMLGKNVQNGELPFQAFSLVPLLDQLDIIFRVTIWEAAKTLYASFGLRVKEIS